MPPESLLLVTLLVTQLVVRVSPWVSLHPAWPSPAWLHLSGLGMGWVWGVCVQGHACALGGGPRWEASRRCGFLGAWDVWSGLSCGREQAGGCYHGLPVLRAAGGHLPLPWEMWPRGPAVDHLLATCFMSDTEGWP